MMRCVPMRLCSGLLKFYGLCPWPKLNHTFSHGPTKIPKISWPIYMAGWGLKFSLTLLVGRELHHFIRWSVVLLGKHVRTEGLSRALLLLLRRRSHARTAPPARLVTARPRRAAGCGNLAEPSFIFAVRENGLDGRVTVSRFGSLSDRGLL